jgi:hypothetical protein
VVLPPARSGQPAADELREPAVFARRLHHANLGRVHLAVHGVVTHLDALAFLATTDSWARVRPADTSIAIAIITAVRFITILPA